MIEKSDIMKKWNSPAGDLPGKDKRRQRGMDEAGRLHLWILRFLTGLLTLFLWLVPLCGIWMIRCMARFGLFRDFFSYIRHPFSLLSLAAFLLSCLGMFWTLAWLCLVCRRLRIVRRIFVWTMIWIPFLNYGLALYVRGLARQEIDHSLYKIRLDDVRTEAQICKTRYPVVLVHGVGFRDFHYFNYWGRIPRELARNGADIYYGHQEAWGTVEDNAAILREKILQIEADTGCSKVNIIAHSKGGLDARHLISGLGMGDRVASLTTICTPHRGSKLVDFLMLLPEGIYRKICSIIDWYFSRLGDKNPDSFRASRQLSCTYAREFNQCHPDNPQVWYQSYASLMKGGLSCMLLCIPYWILKIMDAPNDGLVTEASAQWTNFKGTVKNTGRRGISHGDMIDLAREDYRDFYVTEFYINLVKELAELGF